MENVKTAAGSQLNNDLINEVLSSSEKQEEQKVVLTTPSDTSVDLPAGYITPEGEVAKVAEVRELNGRDEEALGKSGGGVKAYNTILSRATVSIGGEPATNEMLDSMLLGDRDALLLGIYKATFGSDAELPGYCEKCSDIKMVHVDLNTDVETKVLLNPIEDRVFTVEGKNKTFLVALPTGAAQKELQAAENKSGGEKNSILLKHTVMEIDGSPVISKAQVQDLGIMDRNIIAAEIGKRLPGPQFEDIVLTCTDCDGEVVVPFSLGALFRL